MAADPFDRMDPSPDEAFYTYERKVVHIEVGAIEALREAYAELIPPGARVLDLMSSWRSHLPYTGIGPVVGLGMNAAEMSDNPQLDSFVVHNLNREPVLPFPDASFDAVVCAVSVQYLTMPVEVFTDVRRVLVARRTARRLVLEPVLPDESGRGLARQRRRRPPPSSAATSTRRASSTWWTSSALLPTTRSTS